jgi:hypothetical protein
MRVPTVVAVARWRRGGGVSESTHPVTTTLLNYQLSLAEAVRRSNRGITTLLQDLDKVEGESYGALPRTLDLGAYELLIGQITRFAMDKIAQDWETCKLTVSTGTENIANEDCSCELLLRYSLPYKHHLLLAAQTGQPIPKSSFHPR